MSDVGSLPCVASPVFQSRHFVRRAEIVLKDSRSLVTMERGNRMILDTSALATGLRGPRYLSAPGYRRKREARQMPVTAAFWLMVSKQRAPGHTHDRGGGRFPRRSGRAAGWARIGGRSSHLDRSSAPSSHNAGPPGAGTDCADARPSPPWSLVARLARRPNPGPLCCGPGVRHSDRLAT